MVLLSSIGLRISKNLQGSRELKEGKNHEVFMDSLVNEACRRRPVKEANFRQVATLVWVMALLPESMNRYRQLWTDLFDRVTEIVERSPDEVFGSSLGVIAAIRIAKSLQ